MLSEKILTRQRQLVTAMIEKLTPYVIEKGHPADRVLARFFKDHRELGSRDRRFLSACFFSNWAPSIPSPFRRISIRPKSIPR